MWYHIGCRLQVLYICIISAPYIEVKIKPLLCLYTIFPVVQQDSNFNNNCQELKIPLYTTFCANISPHVLICAYRWKRCNKCLFTIQPKYNTDIGLRTMNYSASDYKNILHVCFNREKNPYIYAIFVFEVLFLNKKKQERYKITIFLLEVYFIKLVFQYMYMYVDMLYLIY